MQTTHYTQGVSSADAGETFLSPSDSIFIVSRNFLISTQLADKLGRLGYGSLIFNEITSLIKEIHHTSPAVVITDAALIKDDNFSALSKLLQKGEQSTSIIFFAERYDTKLHLSAIKAGGCAFYSLPIDIEDLTNEIDAIIEPKIADPYRVLIIDDDNASSAYYSAVLERAGMTTRTTDAPLDVIPLIVNFDPDIILLDLYMPECSGAELAKIIRQRPAFTGIPIVILSSETNQSVQLYALEPGADEFLDKDIKAANLISALTSRISRARKIRSLMSHDGLTGLLNRSSFFNRLESELSRTARQNTPLCIAMLDLDNFKGVNDKYGHMTGDKVLKFFANLLQRRLRSSDFIGRFGGDEFIVALPDTTRETAIDLLNELRIALRSYQHCSGEDNFHTTFSCGIVETDGSGGSVSLIEAADQATYLAKANGRNRVEVVELRLIRIN